MERYGIQPIIKQVELTPEEASVLVEISDLRQLIDEEKGFWRRTTSKTTNQALNELESMLLALSSAIQADSHRIERALFAAQDLSVKVFHIFCIDGSPPWHSCVGYP